MQTVFVLQKRFAEIFRLLFYIFFRNKLKAYAGCLIMCFELNWFYANSNKAKVFVQ